MERRWDPVSGVWRMFATHRQDRTFLPPDEFCPLCPTPAGGTPTEIPWPAFDVAVFENRFPSLVEDPPPPSVAGSALFAVAPSAGANEVIVYSDDHHAGLAELDVTRIALVIEVWADRYAELGARDDVAYVFIFENRGVAVGVTLHHPHGQIYAYPDVPPRMRRELEVAVAHHADGGTCLYCDVVAEERAAGSRVVLSTAGFVAFVPFAARFPYEVHLASIRHAPHLLDLTAAERLDLAAVLGTLLRGYDALFGFPLPYVMSMHQAPTDGGVHDAVSHFHIEFTPLHRTAEKLKYLAGSELGAGAFINDTAPEDTAAAVRAAVAAAEGGPERA
jgi:UDPglucose--hexose-1-phosphate uridylyltransferase